MPIKYILPLLIIASLFTLCMPNEWHYKCLGDVQSYHVDTFPKKYHNGEIYDYYQVHNVIYRTKDGEILKYVFETGNDSFMAKGRREMMDKHLDKKVFEYRWYTFCVIYFVLLFFYVIFTAIYMSEADHDCSTCPVYFFCIDKEKERPNWVKRLLKSSHPQLKNGLKV